MYSYLARQSIVDIEQQMYGYELLFRDSEKNCFPDIAPDEATSKLLAEGHLTIGVEEIAGGHNAFINFHQDTLLHRFPTSLDPKKVVIEIVETVEVTPALIKSCAHIKSRGYKLALDDYDFHEKWEPFLALVDIIKIDITVYPAEVIKQHVPKLKAAGVKLIAERVETWEEFLCFKEMGFDYFQGYFFAKPEIVKNKKISSSKMILLELMSASAQRTFDFDKISAILERDVGLSYKLLRFINSPAVDKSNKILSLKHALNYMGEIEVKKFIALLALANVSSDKPSELASMSLARAKFCEMLSETRGDSPNSLPGFLVGLFSMLDRLLEQGMETLLSKLPLDGMLIAALCGKKNPLRDYLSLACAFERGDWVVIKDLSNQLNLAENKVFIFYNQAISWSNNMMTIMTQSDQT